MAAMIDTLEFAKSFRQAGFDQPKAEALAGAFGRARDVDRAELATKSDLQVLRADVQMLETRIDGKLSDLKLDVERTIRTYVIGSNIGLVVVLAALQHFAKLFG